MATITTLSCDMTGETLSDDTPTTRIFIEDARENLSVEIDLSDAAFKGMLAGEAKYSLTKILGKARPYVPTNTRKATTTDADARQFAQEARQWAISTGLQPPVSERGAVPQRALDAYREYLANGGGKSVDIAEDGTVTITTSE